MTTAAKFDRCPFPRCMGEVEHDGDHVFTRGEKPIGMVRQLQTFGAGWIYCEIHPETQAAGYFADSAGFGWQLCEECKREFSGN